MNAKLRTVRNLVLPLTLLVAGLPFAGCTTILGDFELVSAEGGAPPPTPSNCTQCGDECVDTQTNLGHCGDCNQACGGGQICSEGSCACPSGQAFCNGQCAAATRERCGPTCSSCQSDEICTDRCSPAPLPAFVSTPRDPTGWLDSSGKPIRFEMQPTGALGTLYECRGGPAASFSPTVPAWRPCDGEAGTEPFFVPSPDSAAPEGTYRVEYRYRSDSYRSGTIHHRLYVLHKLDKVATCPRPGHPEDGPHFTDAQYFAAARLFTQQYPSATFKPQLTFPTPGEERTADMFLKNPWIKIPFKNVLTSGGQRAGGGWVDEGNDYLLHERSVRHTFVLNADRTMLLVKRQYVHPTDGSCKDEYKIGSYLGHKYGPLGRGRRKVQCEAFVLDSRGVALCLGPNKDGSEPMPLRIDNRPGDEQVVTAVTLTSVSGSSEVTASTNYFGTNAFWLNRSLKIDDRWYRIVGVDGSLAKLAEAARSSKSGPLVWASHSDDFDVPTGYAKLHADDHTYATGLRQPGHPSPHTKCETPGCDLVDPSRNLTYLPP